jgi:hypothetical protein
VAALLSASLDPASANVPKTRAAYGIGCTLRHVTPCRLLRGNLRLPRGNLLKAGG